MITKLEREFYDTFGIKPKWKDKRVKSIKTYYTEEQAQYLRETTKNRNIQLCYPEITAEKLLQMICIYSKYAIFCLPINAGDFEEKWTCEKLKNYILKELICLYKANIYNTNQKLQTEIQQLFKDI